MDRDPHLEILRAVAEEVSRTPDPETVLRTALDHLTRVTGHEISSVHLLAADGHTLELRGDRGLSAALRELNSRLSLGVGLIGRVAATRRTFSTPDVAGAPDLLPGAQAAVREQGVRGFVCVPIVTRGRLLGTLSLGRGTGKPFDEREVALLEATAHHIGLALDNARLFGELVHAEKLAAVGELASGVAHEINNPLTTILGQAELLAAREDLPEPVRKRLRMMRQEASRAARIVQNLLLFARHYPPERQPCVLADEVERVLELKAFQLDRDKIQVVTQFSPCPEVWVDDNQMQQVLLNLVQNAHQAMAGHEGAHVLTVRVHPGEGECVLIEVLDTGPGIPADILPRIFDPFFTTKPPGEGSGLGLAVSYGIVRRHHGTLTAANRPEGGAIFTVELPVGGPD